MSSKLQFSTYILGTYLVNAFDLMKPTRPLYPIDIPFPKTCSFFLYQEAFLRFGIPSRETPTSFEWDISPKDKVVILKN
jgi:hypothetical protein